MDSRDEIAGLRLIADYQFGAEAGKALFPEEESIDIERSRTGRPRQIRGTTGRIVTYNTDGRFTLGIEGGRRLHSFLSDQYYQVVVGSESEPYVRDGRNVFAKFVTFVHPIIRPGDEVLVVNKAHRLLGVGRASMDASAMRDFNRGMAVMVREGESD